MFNFIPGTIPNNVFVIGAGGTGGRLIPMLSQFMRSITRGVSPTGWLESPRIWLIDDDTVEQKNILRQNFIERDVGKHKAAVLAERYTKAYGVDIVPITLRVTSAGKNDLYQAIDNYLYIKNGNKNTNFASIVGNSIVVICVDSVQARRDILNTFLTGHSPDGYPRKTFFVDAGNEDNFGQVTFFTPTIVEKRITENKERDEAELPKLCPVSADVDYIPMNVDYYRDLVDTPAQGSCADLNQTLAINAIMATTIMGVLQNYFYRKPLTYCGISISLNGGNYTTFNTVFDFNNRGTSAKDFQLYMDQNVHVKEKDNGNTRLMFGPYCQTVKGNTLRALLVKKMAVIKQENERLARIAAAKALEEETARRMKIIAERKRAEIRAQAAAAAAINAKTVAETLAASNAKTVAGLKGEPMPVAPAAVPPTSGPPLLVATPRIRTPRNVVELTVPSTWTFNHNGEEVLIDAEVAVEEASEDNDDYEDDV